MVHHMQPVQLPLLHQSLAALLPARRQRVNCRLGYILGKFCLPLTSHTVHEISIQSMECATALTNLVVYEKSCLVRHCNDEMVRPSVKRVCTGEAENAQKEEKTRQGD